VSPAISVAVQMRAARRASGAAECADALDGSADEPLAQSASVVATQIVRSMIGS